VVLKAIAGRTPECNDIEVLCASSTWPRRAASVVVDLSATDRVNSSFLAALITLRKLVLQTGSRLVLCGLQPAIREVLNRTRMDTLFCCCSDLDDALYWLREPVARGG
jgi:anti-anti-sigma factor